MKFEKETKNKVKFRAPAGFGNPAVSEVYVEKSLVPKPYEHATCIVTVEV